MARSRRSSPPDAARVVAAVTAALDDCRGAPGALAVALSGGRDSAALLDAAATAAPARGLTVIALHVHHGLSPHADAWANACIAMCVAHGVRCRVLPVHVLRGPRTSVEAEARRARYAALAAAALAEGAATVLLAHHQDDQAETLLLQLLRGAGPQGLAAMPALRVDAGGLAWRRPLLGVPRAAIDAYVAARALRTVDDESNTDVRYARNALRHRVAPALAALAPGYPATLGRAAVLQAEAALLADELAAIDARGAVAGATLERAALAALPAHRARNLLRWFLRGCGLPAPSQARLEAMLVQLTRARGDARVRLVHAGMELGVHRHRIVVHCPPPADYATPWKGEPELVLPHGRLAFVAATHGALDPARCAGDLLVVRARRGGERLALGNGRPRRALTRVLQDLGLAEWERESLPLLFCGDALAAVPGVGVDAAYQAKPGGAGVALTWTPAGAPAARR